MFKCGNCIVNCFQFLSSKYVNYILLHRCENMMNSVKLILNKMGIKYFLLNYTI